MSQRCGNPEGAPRRFFADPTLGKLARWLRVLGCDTVYRRRRVPGALEQAAAGGRVPLTRDRKLAAAVKRAVFIESDHVREQLRQVCRIFPDIAERPGNRFTLCLECNERLEEVAPEEVRDMVPDYVFQTCTGLFKRCPSCGRCFWPGSHRERMLESLRRWEIDSPDALC